MLISDRIYFQKGREKEQEVFSSHQRVELGGTVENGTSGYQQKGGVGFESMCSRSVVGAVPL